MVTIGSIVYADEQSAMNLRELEYALAVAEHGHFSRAAEACAVSQPTLSGQLRKLEDELGVEIFERDGRTVRTTRVGREILLYARAAIDAVSDIERAAQAGRDPLAGTLRIGVIPTLGPYLLPHLLVTARERIPKLPLAIVEEPTALLVKGVLSGELDAAIVATTHASEGLSEIPIFDEPLWLVVPRDHALAKNDSVAIADIDARSLLLLTDGHCLREQTLALCNAAQRAATDRDLRASSLETLLNLVEAGYGMTVVPALARHGPRFSSGNLIAIRFTPPTPTRRIRLILRASAPRAAALKMLADAARTDAPEDVKPIRTA
jgi:LysR family hydrogen peroxide-inducible transcriptional activator